MPGDEPIKYCPYCGSEFHLGGKYCYECGRSISLNEIHNLEIETCMNKLEMTDKLIQMFAIPTMTGLIIGLTILYFGLFFEQNPVDDVAQKTLSYLLVVLSVILIPLITQYYYLFVLKNLKKKEIEGENHSQ